MNAILRIRSGIRLLLILTLTVPISILRAQSHPNFLTPLATFPVGGCSEPAPGSWECSNPGEFHCPEQLDWYGDYLMVSDSDNHRIQLIDTEGNPVAQLGQTWSGPWCNDPLAADYLCGPHDAAPAPNQTIVVADTYNNRLQIYDDEFNHIGTNGVIPLSIQDQSGQDMNLYPEGLAFNSLGDLFITSFGPGPSALVKFDIATSKILRIAQNPYGWTYNVAVDSNNVVLVNGREYDANLNPLLNPIFNISPTAPAAEQLGSHRGLVFDSYDQIFVAEQSGDIKIFSRSGELLSYLHTTGLLFGIAVNSDGKVFVSRCGGSTPGVLGEIIKYQACFDEDGDQLGLYCPMGTDCNDSNPHQGGPEICGDSYDNDCDGSINEGCGGGPVSPRCRVQPAFNTSPTKQSVQISQQNCQ